MIADALRELLPGYQYDALIPRATGKLALQRKWLGSHDSVKGVQQYAREYSFQMAEVAKRLKGSTTRQTCQNIWKFIYRHIQYKNDKPGYEQIRTPARSWEERASGVDCDDYSIITSSILLNLGIPHFLRMTAYKQGWQHIYVVVPKSAKLTAKLTQARRDEYIVIDAVTNQFDFEVTYQKNEDFPMDIQFLNGLAGVEPDGELGKTWFGKAFQKVGQAAASAVRAVKTVATTPVRLGILAWMKLNVKGAGAKLRWAYMPYNKETARASDLGPAAYATTLEAARKLRGTFVGMGGDGNTLKQAILTGNGNKDRVVPSTAADLAGLGYIGVLSGNLSEDADWIALQQIDSMRSVVPSVAGLEGLQRPRGNGLGVEPATSTVLITAATAVLIPIINLLAKAKSGDPNDPIPAEYQDQPEPTDEQYAADAQSEEAQPELVEADSPTGMLGATAAKKKKVLATVAKKNPAALKKAVAKVGGAKPAAKKPPIKTAVRPAVNARPIVNAKPIAPKPITAQPVTKTTVPHPALPAGKKVTAKPGVHQPTAKTVATAKKVADAAGKIIAKKRPDLHAKGTSKPKPAPGKPKIFGSEDYKYMHPTPDDALNPQKARDLMTSTIPNTGIYLPADADNDEQYIPAVVTPPASTSPSSLPSTLPNVAATTAAVAAGIINKKKPKLATTATKVLNTVNKVAKSVRDVIDPDNQGATPPRPDSTPDPIDPSTDIIPSADRAVVEASSPGFFQSADGKTDLFKVGVVGAGVLLLGNMLFGGGQSAPARRGLRGLDGAKPGKPTKKSSAQAGRTADGKFKKGNTAPKKGLSGIGIAPVALT